MTFWEIAFENGNLTSTPLRSGQIVWSQIDNNRLRSDESMIMPKYFLNYITWLRAAGIENCAHVTFVLRFFGKIVSDGCAAFKKCMGNHYLFIKQYRRRRKNINSRIRSLTTLFFRGIFYQRVVPVERFPVRHNWYR